MPMQVSNPYEHFVARACLPHSQMCGRDAENERLRRSEKVQAGARAFFQRFYLSNSVMEYDPKLIMLAAIFLTSKVCNLSSDQFLYISFVDNAALCSSRLLTKWFLGFVYSRQSHLRRAVHVTMCCLRKSSYIRLHTC
jgi:hypothetical protein